MILQRPYHYHKGLLLQKGYPVQRGEGVGTLFSKLFGFLKTALNSAPVKHVVNTAASQVGKKAAEVVKRISDGESIGAVLRNEVNEGKKKAKSFAQKTASQTLDLAHKVLTNSLQDAVSGKSAKTIFAKQSNEVKKAMKRKLENLLDETSHPKKKKKLAITSLLDN